MNPSPRAVARLLLAATALAAPLSALAEGPRREGFTLTLNLGLGLQTVSPDEGDGRTEVGLAGLNLGLGGFITPDVAALFRLSGSVTTQELAPEAEATYVAGFAGPSLQYFVNDFLRLEVGLGLSIISAKAEAEVYGNRVTFEADDQGFGALVALAATLWQNADHQIYAGVEVAPGFFSEGTVLSSGFVVGWQMF